MMNSNQQPAPINANEEQNFIISSLASQFQMTQEETQLVISIVQQPDPSLELLKHPKVTELIKQRKGRWVQEEEDYANFLSHEFFLGVADLENGITKRAYLSGKLTCTKMRISKKFKGKNTGKEVFVRKARTAEGRDITPYEIQWYKSRHVELEKKFLKAVLKSVLKWGVKNAQKKAIKAAKQAVASAQPFKPLPSCPHPVMQPSINVVQLANAPCVVANVSVPPIDGIGCAQETKVALLAPSPNILIHGKFNGTAFESSVSIQPNNLSTNNNCTNQIGPGSVVMQAPTIQQDLNPNGLVNLSKPTIACVNQPNPNIVSSVTTAAPCGFEIQVNNNAGFDQNNVSTLPMSAVDNRGKFAGSSQVPAFNIDQNATTGLDTYFDIQNNFPAPVPDNEGLKKRNISELVGPLDYRFTPMNAGGGKPHAATASHAVSTSASEPSSNDESENVSSSNEASSYSNYMSKPDNAFKSDAFYHNNNDNIPDLLSGFDKHVASTKRSNATVKVDLPENRPIPEDSHLFAGAGCVAESPYITSKSFDDLHQFLGKGLSTNMMPNLDLNQNNAGNTFQQVNNNGTYHKPAAVANNNIVLSNQMGLPPSHGAAFPPGMAQLSQLPQMPQIPTHSGPQFFHLADGRQSSISNTSDLTTSD